ncbi:hypothetical protein CR201_G0052452 [Pongo abelii]|uniref:Uncharacterized protein n=1 Tax=Pongo abelii TaxID=9601 RepID=A0A2J8RAL6_PONAB|nr:hypothetical protein CR201_G0052452 [Pongo abelii]
MAAAAAGAGSGPWAAQEKKFPRALLSFFIYNPGSGRGKERTRFIVRCRSSATACTSFALVAQAAVQWCDLGSP